MTVGELLHRVSGQELVDWMAYERISGPLGPVRGDWQAAQIAAMVHATAAGRKGKRRKLKDFLLRWASDRRATSDEDMEQVGRQLAQMFGGTWTEGGDR